MSRWNDGGYKSRKLWFAFYITAVMVGAALFASERPGFAAIYGELVGGLVGIAGLLFTGNIAAKWVAGKAPGENVAQGPVKALSAAKAEAVLLPPKPANIDPE